MFLPLLTTYRVASRSLFHLLRFPFCLVLAVNTPTSIRCQTTITAGMHWNTYMGGTADDHVHSVATDEFGHVYVAGRTTDGLRLGNDTTGQSGLTFQDTYGGGASDAFLAKIAPKGSVLWCTYFGGAGDDVAVQVVIADMDGVYLVGHTTSSAGVATDTLAHQSSPGGGQDLFIARFTEHGALVSATYFGGVDDELASGAALDHRGHLLVCGTSNGAGSFANEAPPLQSFTAGTDGLFLRFASTDSLAAGTFMGGEGEDTLLQVTAGDSTGALLVGHTTSTLGIALGNAFSPAPLGNEDGFILKADTNLLVIQGTYFGGSANDRITSIARYGDRIAICGLSYSDTLYADTAAFQQSNAGGGDGFVALLDVDLQLSGSTFYGDTAHDALNAVAFDRLGACYAVGISASTTLSTGSGEGSLLQGATDAWVMRLDSAIAPEWSRYIGALDADEAHALCIHGITAVYVGGRTASQDQFSADGHQMDFAGGTWDGCAARLDQVMSTSCTGICCGTTTFTGSGNCNGVSDPLEVWNVCLGDSVTLIAYGGALGYGARWMWYADECGDPEHFITSGDTITFTPTSSMTLWVRAESVYNTTACRSLPIMVHAWPEPEVTVSDTVCTGTPINMQGTGAETFTWNLMDTVLIGAQVELIAAEAGTHVVQATGTNGATCSVMVEQNITVLPAPTATWLITDISCADGADGSILLLDSTVITTINWSPSGHEGNWLVDLSHGAYIATFSDAHGCVSVDTLMINRPPALMDSVITTDALCGEPTATAQVSTTSSSSGLLFDWGAGPFASSSVEGLAPGSYTVIATNDLGCFEQLPYSIVSLGVLYASIGTDTLFAEDGIGSLHCTTVPYDSTATFQWSPAEGLDTPTDPSSAFTVTDTSTYVVIVVSSAGCSTSDTVVVIPFTPPPIEVPVPCGEAFLPDIFSPNGDGLNDVLCVLGGCFNSFHLSIYDRWGNRLFTSTNAELCWDGSLAGSPVPQGAYAITFAAERSNGEVVEHTGLITLKR